MAMASNSAPSPRSASTDWKRATWTIPAMPPHSEHSTNSATVVRSTGTPRLRAASGFWPIASVQLPKRVRSSVKVAPSTSMANQTSDMRKPPGSRAPDTMERIGSAIALAAGDGKPASPGRQQAAKDIHGAQRHDERAKAGAHDEQAVDQAQRGGDGQRAQECERRRQPDRRKIHRHVRRDAHHRADRQIDVAAYHQQRDADAD